MHGLVLSGHLNGKALPSLACVRDPPEGIPYIYNLKREL